MSNDFYAKPTDAQPLSTIRSAQFNTNNQSLETGFDKLLSEDDTKRIQYGQDGSSVATLYEVTIPKLPGGVYREGLEVTFTAVLENTGTANISVNGGTNEPILDGTGAQLVEGSIKAGQTVTVIRNAGSAGTGFQLTSTVLLQSDIQDAIDAADAAAASADAASDSADDAAASAVDAAEANINDNIIINSAFEFWQRGTSISVGGSNTYTADRWSAVAATTNLSVDLVPTDAGNSLVINGATSNTRCDFRTRIEAADMRGRVDAVYTITGRIFSTDGRNVTLNLGVPTVADTFSSITTKATTTLSTVAASYTDFEFTFTILAADLGRGLQVDFICGALGNALQMAWRTVKLELGSVATSFKTQGSSVGDELALCQRYYFESSSTGVFRVRYRVNSFAPVTTARISGPQWPVTMRVSPSVSLVNLTTSNTTNEAVDSPTVDGFNIVYDEVASDVIASLSFEYTADAEL